MTLVAMAFLKRVISFWHYTVIVKNYWSRERGKEYAKWTCLDGMHHTESVLYACTHLHVEMDLCACLCFSYSLLSNSIIIKKNHISSTRRGNINIILNIYGLANLCCFIYKHKVQYTLGLCVLWYTVTNILTKSTTTRGVRQRVEGERVRQREQGNIEGERSW